MTDNDSIMLSASESDSLYLHSSSPSSSCYLGSSEYSCEYRLERDSASGWNSVVQLEELKDIDRHSTTTVDSNGVSEIDWNSSEESDHESSAGQMDADMDGHDTSKSSYM